VVPEEPAVDIEKATNGQDADTPTGPQIVVGGPVTWTYVVTNIGDGTLTGVTVTDDELADAAIDCGGDSNVVASLASGGSVTCSASSTAAAGQYANVASVATDQGVTDSDPSHYLGVVPNGGNGDGGSDPGAIGDLVWIDADADGYQGDFEGGLAGVTVNLLNSSSLLIDTEITDASGKYLFTGVSPGSYFVQFMRPGGFQFSPADLGVSDALDSDAGVAGRTAQITLSSGEVDLSWDAGLYRLDVLPQVITTVTTTPAAAPEELPFTGSLDGSAAGFAVALAALGGLVLLVVRRREVEAVIVADDWYPRLRHYDLKYWDT
jgi:hypothetical protein